MRLTVNQIMKRVASTVNQEAIAPTDGGTEWSLWLEFINRGLDEWAEASDWEVTRKYYYPTASSGATVLLPLDFKNLAGPVRNWSDVEATSANPKEFPFVRDEDRPQYDESHDKFVRIVGDNSTGRALLFNPPSLASGASLEVTYFSMPTSLASGTQYPVVPDPEFLIDRTIAFIFQARSDPRFQDQEQKSREKLLNMVGKADEDIYANHSNQTYATNATVKRGFRVGRD